MIINSEQTSRLKEFLINVAISIVLAMVILIFIRPTFVNGESMENTLFDGDYMLMAKQAYRFHEPERGDIVIIQSNLKDYDTEKGKLIIKRIVGLPGDEISIVGGELYTNGEKLTESYIKDGSTPAGDIPIEGKSAVVPDNCYYVLGDNRCNSTDSRSSEVGFVNITDIKGKVFVRLFPFTQIKTF